MPGTQNLLFFPRLDLDPSSRFVYLRSESNEFRQSAHFQSDSESLRIPIEYRTKGGGDLGMYPNRRRGTFHHIEQNTPGVGLCVRWCCRQSQQVPAIAVAYTAMPESVRAPQARRLEPAPEAHWEPQGTPDHSNRTRFIKRASRTRTRFNRSISIL